MATAATTASASGLDRTGQNLSPLFEKGRYLGVDGYVARPAVEGVDAMGQSTGNVSPSFSQWGLRYKQDLGPQWSAALMLTKPFGVELHYAPAASAVLGGTQVHQSTRELQGVLRYRFNEQWGVHGGLRLQQSHGSITLQGLAYGLLSGYHVQFARSTKPGYLLGVSYERPEIALRVVATYYSEIQHRLKTTESISPLVTRTDASSPQAFNLDWQTGITPSNLLFGQIRWGNWESFKLRPQALGRNLTDLDNSLTYTLGMAHKIAPQWTGFVALTYEKQRATAAPLSPLRPSDGRKSYTLGLVYDDGVVKISPWVSYSKLGDADVSTINTPLAKFGGSTVKSAGVQLGYHF